MFHQHYAFKFGVDYINVNSYSHQTFKYISMRMHPSNNPQYVYSTRRAKKGTIELVFYSSHTKKSGADKVEFFFEKCDKTS